MASEYEIPAIHATNSRDEWPFQGREGSLKGIFVSHISRPPHVIALFCRWGGSDHLPTHLIPILERSGYFRFPIRPISLALHPPPRYTSSRGRDLCPCPAAPSVRPELALSKPRLPAIVRPARLSSMRQQKRTSDENHAT